MVENNDMNNQPVSQHPASVEAYIRHGWSLVPIPVGTKGPRTTGWNLRENAIKSQADLPPGWGIGLAHAYSGTMALDLDHWDTAAAMLKEHGVDLQALYDAPDAVIIDSGREGHGKLLFAMPFGLTLPSRRISRDGVTVYEMRCATATGVTVQDVLPPSIHPQTNQPYRWGGRGHWTRLPVIPQALLDLWQSLLKIPEIVAPSHVGVPETVDWNDIISAINAVPPDCSRDEWITIGMACQHAGALCGELDKAFEVWHTWSAQGRKYPGVREITQQWNSFRPDKGAVVTMGTLFKIARENGWSRPLIDVSSLFSPTDVPAHPDDLIMDIRQLAPSPPMDIVPEVLREWAKEISDDIGCDPLLPLFSSMVAICGAVDVRTRLEIKPRFRVPPLLWVMSIGAPGDKKSPGSKPAFEILKALEREDAPRYAQAVQAFEINEVRYTAAKKHLLDVAASPESLLGNVVLPAVPMQPVKPSPVKILCTDITSQKLVKQCSMQPRGMLCHMDEMATWANRICDPKSGEARSAWTTAYEADRYEMDRVGTGTTVADPFALAIYGNLQPALLRRHIKALSEDGLVQRFIPIPLRAEQMRLGEWESKGSAMEERWAQTVRVVYGLPSMIYKLSEGAVTEFRGFQTWYTRAMKDQRLLHTGDIIQTAMGKLEGLLGRIALVWHLCENPYSPQVSQDLMYRAVRFIREYVLPAQRYVWDGWIVGGSALDHWMGEFILQYSDQESITMGQIRRSARRHIEGQNYTNATQSILLAMQPLEEKRWVARMDDGSQEMRGSAQWAINPLIQKQFAAHRAAIVEAKQRARDESLTPGTSSTDKSLVHGYSGPRFIRKA